MPCPHCCHPTKVIRKGWFSRKNLKNRRFQRFRCQTCKRYFSETTASLSWRQRRPELHEQIFVILNSGVSQRRTALILGTTPVTIARKLVRLAHFARLHHEGWLRQMPPVSTAVFDDMETFEHSKLKPVSITVAVEQGSRRIIGAMATQMPCKGKNAKKSLKRYGYRKDMRRKGLAVVLNAVARVSAKDMLLKSDQCPRYPRAVRRHVPWARHQTYKSRRACVVGQGEMKAGGFDPLFSLNHTCAMYRDNTKRLSRRTWCTTKKTPRLQCLLDLYTVFHNEWLLAKRSFDRQLRLPQGGADADDCGEARGHGGAATGRAAGGVAGGAAM